MTLNELVDSEFKIVTYMLNTLEIFAFTVLNCNHSCYSPKLFHSALCTCSFIIVIIKITEVMCQAFCINYTISFISLRSGKRGVVCVVESRTVALCFTCQQCLLDNACNSGLTNV